MLHINYIDLIPSAWDMAPRVIRSFVYLVFPSHGREVYRDGGPFTESDNPFNESKDLISCPCRYGRDTGCFVFDIHVPSPRLKIHNL